MVLTRIVAIHDIRTVPTCIEHVFCHRGLQWSIVTTGRNLTRLNLFIPDVIYFDLVFVFSPPLHSLQNLLIHFIIRDIIWLWKFTSVCHRVMTVFPGSTSTFIFTNGAINVLLLRSSV